MKKTFSLLCVFVIVYPIFAQQKNTEQKYKVYGFQISGENLEKSNAETFPITAKTKKSRENIMQSGIVVSAKLDIPETWKGNNLGVVIYKNLMSCDLYVNDNFIGSVGRKGADFFFTPYISRGFIVNNHFLHKGENNIRFEFWNDTGDYSFRMLSVLDEHIYIKSMRLYEFLDVQLPHFVTVLLLFVAIYCFFMFVNYRERKDFLHLTLASMFFAIYMLNVAIYDSTIPYCKLKQMLYACFPLSIIFVIRFFRRFFVIQTPKIVLYIFNSVGIIFTLGYFFMPNTALTDAWHSLMLAYPFAGLVYGILGFVKAVKIDTKSVIAAGVGIFFTLICSVYDMYNYMLDNMPFILLQGVGFMLLLVGTFYSISQSVADTNRQCIIFADELEKNEDTRAKFLMSVQTASEKAGTTGQMLESSISSVSSVVQQFIQNINEVDLNLELQNKQVATNKENVTKIFNAIDEMSNMVTQHESLVKDTVNNVSDITEGINLTNNLMQQSSQTMQKLKGVCFEADTNVANATKLVNELADYSKNVYAIVNSISDISEQTNVLSINAAIEASHSGKEGQGFAVVAGEIRSLANQSSTNAKKIHDILITMIEMIARIQTQENVVSENLKDLVAENAKTEESINQVFNVLNNQLDQSKKITNTISSLVKTVHTISDQTKIQKDSSEQLNQSLELLTSITESVVTSVKEQKSSHDSLATELANIQSASEENVNVTNTLKQLFENGTQYI